MAVAEINSIITELEQIDYSKEFAYEQTLLSLLKIKSFPVLAYEIPEGTSFFRTRTHDTNNLFQKASEICNTPGSLIKNFARCNRPFQSKFYCSENRPTSYIELLENWSENKEVGSTIYVTIGKWTIKKPIYAIVVTTPDGQHRISDFDKFHGSYLDGFIGECDVEIKESTYRFYQFLYEKFSKPAKNDLKTYILTTAYCNLALSHLQGQANAISYPSVQFGGNGVNFAINSDFINTENIELNSVARNGFEFAKNNEGKNSFMEVSIEHAKNISFDNDLIEWK